MGNYVQENLQEGEKIVFQTRLHPSTIFQLAMIVFIAVTILNVARPLSRSEREIGQQVAIFALIATATIKFWNYSISEFALTDHRVLIRVGVIRRKVINWDLDKISEVQFIESLTSKLSGYVDIHVKHTNGQKLGFRAPGRAKRYREHIAEYASKSDAISSLQSKIRQ